MKQIYDRILKYRKEVCFLRPINKCAEYKTEKKQQDSWAFPSMAQVLL